MSDPLVQKNHISKPPYHKQHFRAAGVMPSHLKTIDSSSGKFRVSSGGLSSGDSLFNSAQFRGQLI
jgi:hypothetical protein